MNFKLKKSKIILTLIFCILISINSVYGNNTELLTKIENDFYGFSYDNDTKQNRIARLEKTVYGQTSSGDFNKRITKLSADIAADVIGLEIPPTKDTFLAEDNLAEDSSVNYPIVNDIEMKLFGKTYKNRDFHTRIVTIEKKLFGKIYDVDDYAKRMDRIKAKIMPETIASNNNVYDDGSYYDYDTIKNMDFDDQKHFDYNMPFGQKKYARQYSNYGDEYNRFSTNDDLSTNLSQMEQDIFGTEFPNDDVNTRIKRLNSVKNAKKSFPKYDSQKFSQHMSTAMQIGAMILMILAMVL